MDVARQQRAGGLIWKKREWRRKKEKEGVDGKRKQEGGIHQSVI